MVYNRGHVLRGPDATYANGRVIKKKSQTKSVIFYVGLLVLSPCIGVWLARYNISTQPEQVYAATEQAPAVSKPLVTEPPLPQKAPDSETNPAVQRYLHQWVSDHGDASWGVYVEQLGAQRQLASVNADRQFDIASLYQLFLLRPMLDSMPSAKWASTASSEGGRTIDRCAQDILKFSDNTCANAFVDRIGWPGIEKQTADAGYVFTHLAGIDNVSGTARDAASVIKDIYSGNGYDAYVKDLALKSLKQQHNNQGIPAGCSGCTVYNKTGNGSGAHHDAAIVEFNGKTYALVIMSKYGSNQQLAELTDGILQRFKDSDASTTVPTPSPVLNSTPAQ